jgi:transcriptional regulator with PAS, ATPase and Fis domain
MLWRRIKKVRKYNGTAIDRFSGMKTIVKLKEQLGIIGNSEALNDVVEIVETAAPTSISVLIHGESGTGKEIFANAIHKLSERKHKSFVAINCGALPENLIDSELFGYEKGAFTGAVAQKKGLFEFADGGTIFLDELGEMPLKTQVRLLRVLESGEMVRVGGTESIRVNVRVIGATHQNLEKLIETGEFRRDLYYRLKAITITIPPLRERPEDIELLLNHFIKLFILSNHVIYGGMEDEAKKLLLSYHYPGNIRELKNITETLIVLARGSKITLHQVQQQLPNRHQAYETEQNTFLPVNVNKSSEQVERELIYQTLLGLKLEIGEIKGMLRQVFGSMYGNQTSLPQHASQSPSPMHSATNHEFTEYHEVNEKNAAESFSIEEMERDMITKALDKFAGNRRKAAQALNISERTLYRKIKEFGLL